MVFAPRTQDRSTLPSTALTTKGICPQFSGLERRKDAHRPVRDCLYHRLHCSLHCFLRQALARFRLNFPQAEMLHPLCLGDQPTPPDSGSGGTAAAMPLCRQGAPDCRERQSGGSRPPRLSGTEEDGWRNNRLGRTSLWQPGRYKYAASRRIEGRRRAQARPRDEPPKPQCFPLAVFFPARFNVLTIVQTI
jgi:hypothetical protein